MFTTFMKRSMRSLASLALAGLLLAAPAGCWNKDEGAGKCDATPTPTPTPTKSLYERLGGDASAAKNVRAVVDDFVTRAAPDPKVNFFRKGTPAEWKPSAAEVETFKQNLTDFIIANIGGPKVYKGKPNAKAHAGMMITDAEFNASAGHLQAALDAAKVPTKERDELMAIVGSTRGDIVNK